MFISEKEFLELFGWNDFFEASAQGFLATNENLVRARVIGEERDLYRLQIGRDKTILGHVSGRIRHDAERREEFPAVGDWVMCTFAADFEVRNERAIIHEILPRKSALSRKVVDRVMDVQNIATNVDFLFIATSMNEELSVRRLERYLTVAWDSGAQPVLVLTKADLHGDPESRAHELRGELPSTPIHWISNKEPESFKFFGDYLKRGTTSVVIGSSGVGKSTLINHLVGSLVAKTQEIREDDAKGKHTTSSRYLFQTSYGGLIIDTPGMRELQLLDNEEGLQKQFADIEELVLACKFSDCKHQAEPGCKIQAALKSGVLASERWQSYLKLANEVRHQQMKLDKALATGEKQKWKKISQQAREKAVRKRRDF